MEEQSGTGKRCENCKNYIQHYAKGHSRFKAINCGHCTHKYVKNFKTIKPELCKYWEDNAALLEERKQSVIKTIVSIAKQLNDITVLLRHDLQNQPPLEQEPPPQNAPTEK